MKKRILSLALALSMMISLFPVSALAQTPGGGTAVLAEENGEMKGTTGSITINNSGVPVTDGLDIDSDGNYIGTNWKYNADGEGTLTLMSGTWNLANQNAVKFLAEPLRKLFRIKAPLPVAFLSVLIWKTRA